MSAKPLKTSGSSGTRTRGLRREAISNADSYAKEMITARARGACSGGRNAGDQSSDDAVKMENFCNRVYGRMLAAGNPKHGAITHQRRGGGRRRYRRKSVGIHTERR